MMRFFKRESQKENAVSEHAEHVVAEGAELQPQPQSLPEVKDDASWFARLKQGLSKTSRGLSEGITSIFTKRRLDDEAVEELEEILIRADMGANVATRIVAEFAKGRFDKEIAPEEVKAALAESISALLAPVAHPVEIDGKQKPHVMIVVGVNGNGKTTTIGKMAAKLKEAGYNIALAAADTFRAAAVEQLKVWGERNQVPVVTGAVEADPASVVYQAYEQALREKRDVLIIDTAGRLHNKANLMAELQKIIRVLQKLEPSAPHSVIQVLDATTGQNALAQVEAFKTMVNVTGLVVTKLDGTAKGGVVVALAEKFGLPIHAVGVGEGINDLRSFDAKDFARHLLG